MVKSEIVVYYTKETRGVSIRAYNTKEKFSKPQMELSTCFILKTSSEICHVSLTVYESVKLISKDKLSPLACYSPPSCAYDSLNKCDPT